MSWTSIWSAAWAKILPFAVGLAVLAAFALGSIAIGQVGGAVARVASWLTDVAHVPPLAVVLSPLLIALAIGLARRRRRAVASSPADRG